MSKNGTQKFVAYYRVSTARQGRSGLGLDAQRESVERHVRASGGRLIGDFKEVESGKRADRPELAKALAACRAHGAVLIVAKLDRLARDVQFIAGLMNSGGDFVACDQPFATRLTTCATEIRRPRMVAFPARTSGFCVIRSNVFATAASFALYRR